MRERMGAARKKPGVEQAAHVGGRHWAIGQARTGDVDFNQGFEPQQSARAVADQNDGQASPFSFGRDRARDVLRAHCHGRRVARNENFYARD